MTRSQALFALVLFSGCGGNYAPQLQGSEVWRMFPFDGARTWSYISTDESLAYKLEAHSIGEPEKAGNTNVYNVEYSTRCFGNDPDCVDEEILRKVKWSSDVTDGVYIHAWAPGTDPFVDFDPPVQIATAEMKRDEIIETATGGGTWTSKLLGIEECPTTMSVTLPECGRFEVTTDAVDGFPIAGTYWATVSHGVTGIELLGDGGLWQLSDVECEPKEDCDGSW
jgi:hypothetical protein